MYRCIACALALLVSVGFGLSASAQEAAPKDAGEKKEKEAKKGKEERVERLKPVEVTAGTRTPVSLDDLPVSGVVVSRRDAEMLGFRTVDDMLRYVPGLYRRRTKGFMDTLSGVQMRGFKGRERTLCLFDEIPIHSGYTGVSYLDMLVPYEIERIEVVKGPFSALYGGHAMGGVVKVVPESIPSEPSLKAEVAYGDMSTSIFYLGYSRWLVGRRLAVRVGYKVKTSEGYETDYLVKSARDGTSGTPVSGWRRTLDRTGTKTYYILGYKGGFNDWHDDAFSVRVLWTPSERTRVTLDAVLSRYKYDYSNDKNTFLRDASGDLIYSGDSSASNKVTFNDGGVDKEITLREGDFLKGPGGKWQGLYLAGFRHRVAGWGDIKVWCGLVDTVKDYWFSPSSSTSKMDGTGEGQFNTTPSTAVETGAQFAWKFDTHRVIFGAAWDHSRAHSITTTLANWLYSGSDTGVVREMQGKANLYGVYTQGEFLLKEWLAVVPAVRYDWWRTYEGEGYDQAAGFTEYPTRDADCVSPKLGFLWKIPESFGSASRALSGLRLYGSYGRAFRAPSVYELYRTWSSWGKTYQGNPDLKAEKALGGEIGLRQRTKSLLPWLGETFVSLAYFRFSIEGLVYYETVNATTLQRTNAGRARNEGYELELDQRVCGMFRVWFNFTDTYSRITDNPAKPATEGKRVTYVPRYMYNFGVEWRWRRFTASLAGRFFGKMYTRDDNSDRAQGVPQTHEPFFSLDLRLGWKYNENTSLSLSVENLLDERFFEYSLTPPRTISMQMSLKF